MATSIGSLFLELRLDTQSYQQALQNARSMALNVGKDIDRGLNLKPTVDHTELTKLNQHLDLKQKHFKEVQAYFDRNPLTPRVRLDELQFARSEIKAFRREIQDLKSETAVKIQLQAEHRINTANFESSVDRATKRFEKAGDEIGKKIADRISKASVKVSGGGVGGGVGSGILFGVTQSIGSQIARGFSLQLNNQLANFGRTAENYVTRRAGRAAVGISQDLGYRNTREMRRDIGRVGSFVDGFIDPKRVRAEGKKFEENLSKAAIAFFSEGQSFKSVARQFAKDMTPEGAGKGAAEAGLRVAGFGLRQVSPVLRINKDVQLAKAAKQADRIAEQIEINQETIRELEKANAIVFAIGGLHQAGGKGGAEIVKPQLQRMMPGAYVQGVSNKYRDSTDAPAGIDAFLGKIKPGLTTSSLLKKAGLENQIPIDYLKFLDTAVFSGATPEVIQTAAKVKALQRISNKPAYAVGYSSGGADVADLVRLSEMMGTGVKGVGLGSPVMGIANRQTPNFTPILGQEDYIYKSLFRPERLKKDKAGDDFFQRLRNSGNLSYVLGSPSGVYTPQGAGQLHKLGAYLASPDVQGFMGGVFPGTVPTPQQMPSSLVGQNAIKSYDFIQYQSEQRFDRTLNKINEARSTPSPIVRSKLIEELKSERSKYEQQFRKTEGSIKEELNALLETLKLGIDALEEMQKGSGLPTKQYRDLIDQMNKQVGKYYELSDNNAKLQRERFFAGEQLEPPPPEPKLTIAQKGQKLAQKGMEFAGNVANSGAIAAINNKLARSGAFQDELGFTPQIASLGDLSPRGYLEIAKQDMGATMKFLQGTVGKGYGVMQGVENAALSMLPFGKGIKAGLQNVALPAVAFGMATHALPGGGAIAHGATEAMGQALQLPLGGLGEAVTVAVNNSLTGAISNIPVVGSKLAPAMSGAISEMVAGAVQATSGAIASAAVPVLGGQAMLAPVKAAGSAIVGDQSQLIEASTQKAKMIGMGIDRAGKILTARPETTQRILDQAGVDLKQLNAQLDQGLAKLSPLERTGTKEGNQLAQLKSQVSEQEKKINLLLKGLQQMIQSPGQMMEQSIHPEIIDAEYEVVSSNQLRPATAKMLPSQDLVQQAEKNAIARIKQLGQTFSKQREFVQSKQYGSSQVALEIQQELAAARKVVDDVMASMGKQASKGLKEAAKTARQQMTNADKVSVRAISEAKESGKLGQDMVSGVNTGLQQGIAGARSAAQQLSEAIKFTIQDEFEIKSPSRWMIRMMQFVVQGAEIGLNGVSQIGLSKKLEPLKKEAEETVKGVVPELGKLGSLAVKAFSMLPSMVQMVVGAFAALPAIGFAVQIFSQIAEGSQQAALELESLSRALTFTEGTSDRASAKLAEISKRSNELGINAREAQKAYAQLSAVTRDTPLEGEATKQISEGANIASSAFNLDPEKQKSVNLALQQMASKGVVSMEELRQQLGEALPGAMNIAARSMNMTNAEFIKMVESGQLLSEQFLPKFGQQLKAELGGAAESGAQSAQGAFNRLQNSITDLQTAMGQGMLPLQALGSDALAKGIGLITNNFKALAIVVSAGLTVALYDLGVAIGVIPANLMQMVSKFKLLEALQNIPANLSSGFKGLASGISGMMNTFGGLIMRLGAVAIAFTAISAAIELFSDKAGEMRTIADSNKKSLDELQKTLEKIGVQKPKDESPVEKFKKESVNALVSGKLAPETLGIESLMAGWNKLMERKKFNDESKAIGETIQTSSKITSLIPDPSAIPNLQKYRTLTDQIEENQMRQRALRTNNPQDAVGLAELQRQGNDLFKQQQEVAKPINDMKAKMAANITALKSQIEAISNDPQRSQELEQLKKNLRDAEQRQQDYNEALQESSTRLARFVIVFNRAIADMEDAVTSLKAQQNTEVTQIGRAEASGAITPGQAGTMRSLADQNRLQNEIVVRQQAIESLKAKLEQQGASKVLAIRGLTDANSQRLNYEAEQAPNGSPEKTIFSTAAKLKDLQQQVSQMDADLATSAGQMTVELYNAKKSIDDFYRGIARQSQELVYTLKNMDLDTKMNTVKAQIKGAMTGFYSTFVDEFADNFISIFEMGQEQLKNINDQQLQIMQRQQQLEDTRIQAGELQRGLPGIGSTSTGGAIASGLYTAPESRNGGSAAYHIDTKFSKALSMDMRVAMMDAVANAYAADGRKVEFSNPAVAGAVYDPSDPNRKELLRKAQEAHSHSQYADWESVDYYIPKRNENRFGKSAEGAQIMLPTVPGGKIEYGSGGGYGNYALIYDSKGNLIAKTGHGDSGVALPQSRSFSQMQAINNIMPTGRIASVPGLNQDQSAIAQQVVAAANSLGATKDEILRILMAVAQESSFRNLKLGQGDADSVGILQQRPSQDWGSAAEIQNIQNSVKSFLLGKGTNIGLRDVMRQNPRASAAEQIQKVQRSAYPDEYAKHAGLAQQILGRGGSPMNPTTGMSNGQMAQYEANAQLGAYGNQQIQASLAMAQADTEKFNAAIAGNTAAKNALLQVQQQKLINRSRKQLKNEAANVNVQAQEFQRQNADITDEVGYKTPTRELNTQLRKLNEQRVDTERKYQLQIDQTQNAYDSLDNMIKVVEKFPDLDPGGLLPSMKENLQKLGRSLRIIQQEQKKSVDSFTTREKDIRNKFAKDEPRRVAEGKEDIKGMQVERSNLVFARMQDNSFLNPLYNPMEAAKIQRDSQLAALKVEKDKKLREIDEVERTQAKGADPQIYKDMRKALEDLNNQKIDDVIYQFAKLELQAKRTKRELDATSTSEIFNSVSKLGDANIEGFRIVGMERFAKDIEREKALAQERQNLAQEMQRINDLYQDGKITESARDTAIANTDQLFNKKIDNIKRQYSVLNEVIANNKGAFQEFFASLLNGTESIGSAFSKMVQSIANNLANMASDFLTNELMGIFTGKNRNANKKDAKDLFGNVSPAVTYDQQGRELSIAAENAGTQFVGLTQQAGQQIVAAAEAFNQIVSTGGFSSIDGGNLPIRMMDFTGETSMLPDFATAIDTSSSKLFESAQNASFSILDGVQVASEYLTNAGTGTSDNLLSGLSKGLPGILQSVLGGISGKGGGGGIGGIFGSLISPLLGGLFGGGGDIMGGLNIDLGSPVVPMFGMGGFVPNYANGGLVGRPTVDGRMFKNGSNPLADAVRREGSGAIVSVLKQGEYVLTPNEAQMYMALGFDKIIKGRTPNFKAGGAVGGNMGGAARFTRGQEVSITVPVTVSDGSSVNPQKLAESIRGAVQNEIAKQQRPGGQLY